MFTLKIENENGDILTLTQDESRYQVIEVDGLNPPKATITSSEVVGKDGSQFQSSKLEDRNLVLTVKINGNVEANRLNLYRYIKSKRWHRIYYTNGSRDVYIEGYVETIENSLFTIDQTVQVSIVCHDPYFKALHEIYSDISTVLSAFEFPFAFGGKGVLLSTTTDEAVEFSILERDRIVNIPNEGESDTGLIITITATGNVTNPTIYNNVTHEFFGLKMDMLAGDEVTINTNRGQKSVSLMRGGVKSNIIAYVSRDSTWLALNMGDNQFTYSTGTEGGEELIQIVFKHRELFEGV